MSLFKEKNLEQVSGTIERIGVTPGGDTTITYVIKMNEKIYHCDIALNSKERFAFAIAKENDKVTFKCNQEGEIAKETFKNYSA